MSVPLYIVKRLIHEYNAKRVLSIEDLTLEKGAVYCVYGANGSGKSTLFSILTMVIRPTSGTILFEGHEIYPGSQGIRHLRDRVTLVHQNPLLFDTTVERNVDYGLRIRHVPKARRTPLVRECLAVVGLDGFQDRGARTLSGGEAQRVAIARALAISPRALFMDEFSANIDAASRIIIENIIKKINKTYGTTILFTTHSLDQAYRLADTVIHLFEGKMVAEHIQNVFRGRIEHTGAGTCFQNAHLSIFVVASVRGPASIAIPVNAITISKTPLASSMRNCMPGRLSQIIDDGSALILRVDAGEIIEAQVTRESFHAMGLAPGQQVFVSFKASSVTVL